MMAETGEVVGLEDISEDGRVFFCGSQSEVIHALRDGEAVCLIAERNEKTTGRSVPVEFARRMDRRICRNCLREMEADDG